MVIEAALPAAERQQVGILDKRLLQALAEAVGIAGPPRLDNDIEVDRPRPGRSNRAWFSVRWSTASKMKSLSVPERIKLAHAAIRRLYSTSGLSDPSHQISRRAEATRRTQPLAGVSSFLRDLSFALAAAPLPRPQVEGA